MYLYVKTTSLRNKLHISFYTNNDNIKSQSIVNSIQYISNHIIRYCIFIKSQCIQVLINFSRLISKQQMIETLCSFDLRCLGCKYWFLLAVAESPTYSEKMNEIKC